MIADFYKILKEKDATAKLPTKVVTEINKSLPKGYVYEFDNESGKYVITPSKKQTPEKYSGTIDRKKNNIPDSIPQDKIAEYMYRTQRVLEVDNLGIIDRKRFISLDELYIDPITGEKPEGYTKCYIYPRPFPKPVPVQFTLSDGVEINIDFQRQPYESMEYLKFTNVSFPGISIEWIIPDKKNIEKGKNIAGKISITVDPRKSTSIPDVLLSFKIYKDFMTGMLFINGEKIGKSNSRALTENESMEIEKRISYWEGLEKLEGILNVKFYPNADYPDEDKKFASELIHCFVNHKDLVYSSPFRSFHVAFDAATEKDNNLLKLPDKPTASLAFVGGPGEATLLGARFDICEANVLVDMKVERIIIDDDNRGADIYITDAPGVIYKVIKRYYLTLDEAQANLQRMFEDHTALKISKPIDGSQ